MDISVKQAIFGVSRSRIMGYRIKQDDILSRFWNAWDENVVRLQSDCDQDDLRKYIKLGEKCINNFVKMNSRFNSVEVAANDMHGIVHLPRDNSIEISIDEIGKMGLTAFVCRYVTDPGLRSKEELMEDPEMTLCASWASDNIPGVRKVMIQWRFLASDLETSYPAELDDVKRIMSDISDEIDDIRHKEPLPRESDLCRICRYKASCPRFIHELSLNEENMHLDEGVRLVDEYAELDEKISALKKRQEVLKAQQDVVGAKIVAFSDHNHFMSVTGHTHKALIRRERRADFPQDKTAIIDRLKRTGEYDSLSTVNYPRLRSDVLNGRADPEIVKMTTITENDKIYLKKR